MKSKRMLFILIALFVVIAAILQMQVPQRFNWDETYSPSNANPFGTQLFDSVLKASMPKGYKTQNLTLWQAAKKNDKTNLLVLEKRIDIDSLTWQAINTLTRQGRKIILVPGTLAGDTATLAQLGLDIDRYNYSFDISRLKYDLSMKKEVEVPVYWKADGHYPAHRYHMLEQLVGYSRVYVKKDAGWDTIAYARTDIIDSNDYMPIYNPVVLHRKLNKGDLYVVRSSLIFTNFGMLDKKTQGFIFRVINLIADKPVMRATKKEASQAEEEKRATPFRAIFSSMPLTWAFYTLLAVLLLFFIFTARRRQRAIPVITPPSNHTLEFTRLIGTLFYQQHDRTGLVRRKWEMFAAIVRQRLGVDVETHDNDDELFTRLSVRTGLPYEHIATTIKHLRYIINNENNITSQQMKMTIQQMDDIIKRTV